MADPMTISAATLGLAALTEGIKFLYGQAGELLKHWREQREKRAQKTSKAEETADAIEPANVVLPANAFEGRLVNPAIHLEALDAVAEQLSKLRQDLIPYMDGLKQIDPANKELLARVDALRRVLEAIFQQRITFKGEQRPSSGPDVEAHIKVEEVLGYVAVVRARQIKSGQVQAEGQFGKVAPGAEVVGIDVDTLGE